MTLLQFAIIDELTTGIDFSIEALISIPARLMFVGVLMFSSNSRTNKARNVQPISKVIYRTSMFTVLSDNPDLVE